MKLTNTQLARIKGLERRGKITARRVYEDAKNAKSPLHALFDWNVQHAAEKWWLHRARLIIGAVTVEVTHNHTVITSPAYVVDTTATKGGGYQSVVSLKADPDSARESLIYTLEVAAGHIRRAYDLSAPLGLQRQIDQLLAQIAGVMRVVEKKAA